MKHTILTAALIGLTLTASAQTREVRTPKTPEQRAAAQTERVSRTAQLTPEQRSQIERIDLETARRMQPHVEAVRKEKTEMRAIQKERHEAYKKVLSPEQMQALRAAHRERKAARMSARPGVRDGRMEQRMQAPAVDR